MATSKEIRIGNLRALVKEFRTADAVAQRAATAPMYLSQILNSAKSSTGTARGVGDKLARKLEVGCDKPEGWMDVDHGADMAEDANQDHVDPAAASPTHHLLPGARRATVGESEFDAGKKTKAARRGIEVWQQEDAARLKSIFDAKKAAAKHAGDGLTQESLAESAGIASPNMVWQYLTGHRPLNIKAASAFAKGLGVQVRDFSPRLAEEIEAVAPARPTQGSDTSGDYSLSLEKLLLINAINEREAALLRRYRMASDVGAELIEIAASTSPTKALEIAGGNQAQNGPLGAGDGHRR